MDTDNTINPGLCRTCQHVKRSETHRGSVFWLCTFAFVDTSFRKYPSLPVMHCRAYQPHYDATLPPVNDNNES